jgi:hypothetical protein
MLSVGDEAMMELGGNIELVGFKELDNDSLVIVKKIVGNYGKKLSEGLKNFQKLSITMKPIHGHVAHNFELHGKLLADGQVYTYQVEDHNLFVGLDSVLKKLEHELEHMDKN